MPPTVDIQELAARFDVPGIHAVALMGSYARGDPGEYSDVDLFRFAGTDQEFTDDGSYLIRGVLVVVGTHGPAEVEGWFNRPEIAVGYVPGLRDMVPLWDPEGLLARLQQRARTFVWDQEIQARANNWASEQMVGWIEEVHKGLEGLQRGGVGRLLNARFGLSWGLSRVLQVQRGVMLTGDNTFFEEVGAAVGLDSEWTRLRRLAFGVEAKNESAAPPLAEQVKAGLLLYAETARLLGGVLPAEHRVLVNETVRLIASVAEATPG